MLRKTLLASAMLLASCAASASVIVLGNHKTGEVVVEGNAAGGTEADRAVAKAKGGSDAGWIQIYGPDEENSRGWGTVLCVKHKDGFFFAEAIGQSSEAEAKRIVNLKADRFLARLVGGEDAGQIEKVATWPELARQAADKGIGEKVECAMAWNNQSQPISYSGKASDVEDASTAALAKPASEVTKPAAQEFAQVVGPAKQASASVPKRDYEAEYQAKLRVWEQQRAEHRRKVEEHEEAHRQFEARKIAQREQALGVLGNYQQQLAEHAVAEADYAEERRRWEMALQQHPLGASDGSHPQIADAFKVQNDAEWKKVSERLPAPRNFPGHPWAYCYQPSLVDSSLYESRIFSTLKQETELELEFSDEVARKTRIGSAMSTHCYVTSDASWLDRLRDNVRQVHADKTRQVLSISR